jgi:hypothetical protein
MLVSEFPLLSLKAKPRGQEFDEAGEGTHPSMLVPTDAPKMGDSSPDFPVPIAQPRFANYPRRVLSPLNKTQRSQGTIYVKSSMSR